MSSGNNNNNNIHNRQQQHHMGKPAVLTSSSSDDGNNSSSESDNADLKGSQGTPYAVIKSSYRDFSRVPPDAKKDRSSSIIAQSITAKEPTFPVKLHMILSNPEFSEIVAWLPHGRSWRIVQQKGFEERVIPLYFRHGRYSSFARQVNGWNFRRITHGSDYNSYYHELFLRGLPHLCDKMRRLTAKDMAKRKKEDEEPVPDFYSLSRDNPLPESSPIPDINVRNTTPPAIAAAAAAAVATSTTTSAGQDMKKEHLADMEISLLEKRRADILDRINNVATKQEDGSTMDSGSRLGSSARGSSLMDLPGQQEQTSFANMFAGQMGSSSATSYNSNPGVNMSSPNMLQSLAPLLGLLASNNSQQSNGSSSLGVMQLLQQAGLLALLQQSSTNGTSNQGGSSSALSNVLVQMLQGGMSNPVVPTNMGSNDAFVQQNQYFQASHNNNNNNSAPAQISSNSSMADAGQSNPALSLLSSAFAQGANGAQQSISQQDQLSSVLQSMRTMQQGLSSPTQQSHGNGLKLQLQPPSRNSPQRASAQARQVSSALSDKYQDSSSQQQTQSSSHWNNGQGNPAMLSSMLGTMQNSGLGSSVNASDLLNLLNLSRGGTNGVMSSNNEGYQQGQHHYNQGSQ